MAEQSNPAAAIAGARCAEHPERPAVGTCERCGSFFCSRCAGRREEGRTFCVRCWEGRSYVPWEDPALGTFEAYFETVKRSVLELPVFARELPLRGGMGRPLIFALLPTAASAFLASSALGLFVGAMMPAFLSTDATVDSRWVAAGGALFYFLMFSGSYLFYLLAWPGVLVLCAKILPGGRPATYQGMYRALCYSSGFNLLYFVPALGMLVWLYQIVVGIACIASQLQATVARAAAIYLAPVMIFAFTCIGSYLLLFLFASFAASP